MIYREHIENNLFQAIRGRGTINPKLVERAERSLIIYRWLLKTFPEFANREETSYGYFGPENTTLNAVPYVRKCFRLLTK